MAIHSTGANVRLNPASLHVAITPATVAQWQDRWDLLEHLLAPAAAKAIASSVNRWMTRATVREMRASRA